MKDRIPTRAGRVLVTPEDGSPAYYATLTMADEPTQEGDAPVKANLLTDETAEMLGLGDDGTVNLALAALARNSEWKTLADVTVAEDTQSLSIALEKDLSQFREFFIVGSTRGVAKTVSFRVYIGDNATNTSAGSLTVYGENQYSGYYSSEIVTILSIEDGLIFLSPAISNTYNGGKVYVGEAKNIYLLGYGTQTSTFVKGSRIMIIAR